MWCYTRIPLKTKQDKHKGIFECFTPVTACWCVPGKTSREALNVLHTLSANPHLYVQLKHTSTYTPTSTQSQPLLKDQQTIPLAEHVQNVDDWIIQPATVRCITTVRYSVGAKLWNLGKYLIFINSYKFIPISHAIPHPIGKKKHIPRLPFVLANLCNWALRELCVCVWEGQGKMLFFHYPFSSCPNMVRS